MRILALIVAYNPDPDALSRNLSSFSDDVDKVLLWQNSSFIFSHPKVELCGPGSNVGIGPALNYARERALVGGYDYLLTMDQDSSWNDFHAFVSKASDGPDGIYGPFVNQAPEGEFTPSDFLITSGMLLPAHILQRLGPWREDFFVDGLDVDCIMRARELGITPWRVGAGSLSQQFGKRRKAGPFHVYDYSPERLFGIFRNHIIIIRRYGPLARDLRRMFVKRWIFSRPVRILLGEKNRLAKFKAIWKGIRDGFRWHGKRIGLVTWFGTGNYGTTLQAYASAWALRRLGCEPSLIHRFEEPDSFKAVRENFNRKLGIRRFWKYAPDPWPVKTRRIKEFCAEMPQRRIVTKGDLRRLRRDTGLFLCGSDQLWNPQDHFRPFEFLRFADGCPRAAFATSLGVTSVPDCFAAKMREWLSGFGPISLREESGVAAISALSGREDILWAPDPTFLLSADDWKALSADIPLPEQPYILCYLLRQGQEEMLKEAIERTGISKVLSIPAGENPHPGTGEIQKDAGIREFVSLVGRAALVITDSFHGVALSANLSRDMIIFKRFKDDDPSSQNGRLYELAKRLELEGRFWGNEIEAIDWSAVQQRISAIRSHGWDVLKKTVL